MLLLLFKIGVDRYAIAATEVEEVLPLVHLHHVPQAPAGVAGIFDYHGKMLPVVDLSELMHGRKSTSRISTRIILVRCPADPRIRTYGLIAEQTTETLRRQPEAFVSSGLRVGGVPVRERVTTDAGGVIYWLDTERLRTGPLAGLWGQTDLQNA